MLVHRIHVFQLQCKRNPDPGPGSIVESQDIFQIYWVFRHYILLGYYRPEGEADSEISQVGFSSLPVFLPTILKDMGFNAVDSQGLTAPPFFLSFLVTIFSAWVADKTQQRGYTIMVLTTVGGIGYILLATVKTVGKAPF